MAASMYSELEEILQQEQDAPQTAHIISVLPILVEVNVLTLRHCTRGITTTVHFQ